MKKTKQDNLWVREHADPSNSFWPIIDSAWRWRLINSAWWITESTLLLIRMQMTATKVYCLHGLPAAIITDRDRFSQASFGESCSDKFLLSPPIRRSNTIAQPDHGDFSSVLCECMPIKWFSGYILQNTGITLVVTRQSADLHSKHYTGILQSLLVFLRIFPRLLVKSVLGISIASWPTLWLSSICLDIGCGG